MAEERKKEEQAGQETGTPQTQSTQPTQMEQPVEKKEEKKPYGFMDLLGPRPLTDAERNAELKREKQKKMWAAIGDGVSAMSDLYFAFKGAPSTYNPNTTLSAKTQQHWDKLREQRQKDQDNWYKAVDRIENMRDRDALKEYREKEIAMKDKANKTQADYYDWLKEREIAESKQKEEDRAEKTRQFNESLKLNKSHDALQWEQFNNAKANSEIPVMVGNEGYYNIRKDVIANNIANWFGMIPEEIRDTVHGRQIGTSFDEGGASPTYANPSESDMWNAISTYMSMDTPEAKALRNSIKGISSGKASGGMESASVSKSGDDYGQYKVQSAPDTNKTDYSQYAAQSYTNLQANPGDAKDNNGVPFFLQKRY